MKKAVHLLSLASLLSLPSLAATMATTDYVNSRVAAATNAIVTVESDPVALAEIAAATNAVLSAASEYADAVAQEKAELVYGMASLDIAGVYSITNEINANLHEIERAGLSQYSRLALALEDARQAATNYTDAAVEEALNLYILNTNAQIVVSNETLKVWEMLDDTNALRYTGIGSASFASATNSLSSSLSSLSSLVSRKIESPSHWADFAASGATNAQDTVMLDRGSVTFTDGTVTWTAQGGYYFLTGHATARGSSSQFRIGADADDWFGLEVVASYLADIDPNSINVGTTTVTVGTAFDDAYLAEAPHVYFTESLGLDFVELEGGVSWAQSGNNYVATISGIADVYPSGFFRLKAQKGGGAIMRSTMPILPEGYRVENGGVYVDTVQPDSVITIQSGGKTYKVIAEEVK